MTADPATLRALIVRLEAGETGQELCARIVAAALAPAGSGGRMMIGKFGIPEGACGLRLCKIAAHEELKMSQLVMFRNGAAGVDTALRRAAISGAVGPVGETGDYWADIYDAAEDLVETIALDRGSWNSLKRRWARCKLENPITVDLKPRPHHRAIEAELAEREG